MRPRAVSVAVFTAPQDRKNTRKLLADVVYRYNGEIIKTVAEPKRIVVTVRFNNPLEAKLFDRQMKKGLDWFVIDEM
jgi:hypothetical protein